jgi:hypothetical protein
MRLTERIAGPAYYRVPGKSMERLCKNRYRWSYTNDSKRS